MQTTNLIPLFASLVLTGCFDTNVSQKGDKRDAINATENAFYSQDTSKKAFSHPVANMNNTEMDTFVMGRSFFTIPWVEAPSATTARDGLGPLFNANTCIHCHPNNGAGVAVDAKGALRRDLIIRLALSSSKNLNNVSQTRMENIPEPTYGTQLSINGNHNTPFEGNVRVNYELSTQNYPDGTPYTLRKPTYTIDTLGYGPLHPDSVISPRIALALVGLGLIEAIPQGAILAHEDINDDNNDGISGKANWVYTLESNSSQLGRFTWKASSPNVRFQSANAASNDMGLTSPLFPKENCTKKQKECHEAPKGMHEFDLPENRLNAIAFYVTHLKTPQPRAFEKKEEASALFEQLTCNRCHVPSYTTTMGMTIAPYSDFLLHDMGEELADGVSDFLASGNEWRTPPLWGIGLYEKVSLEANYLHDGRARSIEEAILWHGGEAKKAKDAFMNLEKSQRELLINYLGTI
jgi:CxxC motif-containing protein (DUF1111 family)